MSYDPVILRSDIYSYDYFQQDDVCRLCWSRNAFKKIIEISSDNDYKVMKTDLVEKIMDCLDIDLSHHVHPNKVCDECFNQINKFYYFKKFCQETDKKLRELNENNKSVPRIEIIELDEDEIKNKSIDDLFDDIQSYEQSYKTKIKRSKYKPKRTPTYCNMCRTDFENVDQFKSHNLQHHGIECDGSYKCFGCEKKFKNQRARSSHERHFCKGLKDGYKCSICNRYIPKRGMFEAHMRDHRGNVPIQLPEELFKCQKCKKMFRTMENLKVHMESEHYVDKKMYVCESCSRVFKRIDYLTKHKLTHTGEKLHECPHCWFRTAQRTSLTLHIRQHTGERPYRCNLCPQRCLSKANLRAHQSCHHGVEVHERHACEHCGASYKHSRGLRIHIAAKHTKKDKADS